MIGPEPDAASPTVMLAGRWLFIFSVAAGMLFMASFATSALPESKVTGMVLVWLSCANLLVAYVTKHHVSLLVWPIVACVVVVAMAYGPPPPF